MQKVQNKLLKIKKLNIMILKGDIQMEIEKMTLE